MIKTLLLLFSLTLTSLVYSNDNRKIANAVSTTNQRLCKSPYNCFKPINIEGSKVKVLEINVLGTEKMNIKLYDKDGQPVDLEEGFVIEVKGTKSPTPQIDALIKKK